MKSLQRHRLAAAVQLTLLAALPLAAVAQEAAPASTPGARTLDTVQVTGSRISSAELATQVPVQVLTREDIQRSRGDRVRDKHFSVTNNDELIKFCKGTGLRRSELGMLKGGDLVTKEEIEREIAAIESVPVQERTPAEEKRLGVLQDTRLFDCGYYIHVRNGKGGRERVSPIVGKNAAQIVERIRNTPNDEKVWQHIHQSADIHGYRAEYATDIYRAHARPIEEIPYDRVNKGTGRKFQSDVYTCRKDESGKKLDKKAMLICSKALGHNRIEVVANNYIRGL